MKAKTISAQYTINLGQYESFRIGGEWEVEPGETETQCLRRAAKGLKATAELIRRCELQPETKVTK